ncbi:glycine cleavage system t protein [Apiospora rasikravindrae]|uniref:Aminomethyltransferase n=1 Tax=Apiospora rasikravindrae TaxID=990691 RepID=A0ABR1T604_9PEZI
MKLVRALQRGRKAASSLQSQPARSIALLSRPLSAAAASPGSAVAQYQQQSPRTALAPSSLSSKASRRHGSSLASDEPLKQTPLYDLHLAHGAKMVPFGGFQMPVQYSSLSVSASHHFTRSHASLFDVGHMVQHRFSGPGAAAFLERITPASLGPLPVRSSTLSTLLWPGTGGIVDDTIITKLADDAFYVVTNAACRDKDLKYLGEQLAEWTKSNNSENAKLEHEVLDGWGLVALQGPLSEEILSSILVAPEESKLRELYFGQCRPVMVKTGGGELSQPILVSRGGYTGEDGFEISIPPADTVAVTEALLESAGPEKLQFAGLGARDSLRLEAGMCLYGHDLDDTTTPVEGALSWVIGKDRRDPASKNPFHGAEVILPQLTPKSKGGAGVSRRRVGLVVEGAPAREGAEIVDSAGQKIGVVTSGCPSPTLGKNIAMGYVADGSHKAGTELEVVVRGRKRKAVVTKMPFVPSKYWKGTAPA